MTPRLGIEPGPHWWEASALTTAPSLHSQALGNPQAAQTRRVENYKDLYGNLDNKLKKVFTRKSSQQKSRTLLS